MSSASADVRPVERRTASAAVVSILIAIAVIAGLLLSRTRDAPAPRPVAVPRSIVHAGLRVPLPSGWERAEVVTVPGFSRPLGLHNADAGLRASVERLPATSATLLPAAFVRALEGAPERPDLVRLASGRQAWRYRFPGGDGSMTLLYTAPTTSGVATVACTSPLEDRVPRACDALAAAVTVPGSDPLTPSRNAAFFSRFPGAVHDLNTSRTKGLDELAAATRPTGQALAADRLARAHRAAGAALAPVSDGRGLPGATAGALTATAQAYAALASAARARSPQPYAEASRAVTDAETGLRRTLTKAAASLSLSTSTATRAPVAPMSTPAATAKPPPPKPAAKPKTRTKPASTKPAAKASPEARTSHGTLSFAPIILGLLAVVGIFATLAERATRPAKAPSRDSRP
ncbi:MAG: hypothetical protein ABI611_19235 [Solirubrobacteraceae bacterium]